MRASLVFSDSQVDATDSLVFHLATHLRWPTLTWLSSNSYASRRKFFTVGPQCICMTFLRLAWTWKPTCESVCPPITSPAHRTQVLVLHTCVDGQRLLLGPAATRSCTQVDTATCDKMHQVLKMHLPLPECVECAHVTLYNATGGLGDYNMEP